MNRVFYLDFAATTPLHPFLESNLSYWHRFWANPLSLHPLGHQSLRIFRQAQEIFKNLWQLDHTWKIIFTSGASEGNSFVFHGLVCKALTQKPFSKPHVVVTDLEHPSVTQAVKHWQKLDLLDVTWVRPKPGEVHVTESDILNAIRPETRLVSCVWVHSIFGSIMPIESLAAKLASEDIYLHTDATQALGRLPVKTLPPVDFLTASAHKFYGPKGVGLLLIRRQKFDDWPALIHGSLAPDGYRSGTINTPGVAMTAQAAIYTLNPHILEHQWVEVQKRRQYFLELWERHAGQPLKVLQKAPFCPHYLSWPWEHGLEFWPSQKVAVSFGSACDTHKSSSLSYVRLTLSPQTPLEHLEAFIQEWIKQHSGVQRD